MDLASRTRRNAARHPRMDKTGPKECQEAEGKICHDGSLWAGSSVERSGVALCHAWGRYPAGMCLAARPRGVARVSFPGGGHTRAEDAAGRATGTVHPPRAEGLHRGLPAEASPGVSGAGAGLGGWPGCSAGFGEGKGASSWPCPHPPSLQVVLGSGQAGDGEVAGRGRLESCLLSRGLISKTGRLILTEAADGTACRCVCQV